MARIHGMTMTGHNRGLLVLAGLAGLVAAVLVFVALASAGGDDGSNAPAAANEKAVVAKQSIAAGTTITAEMVEVTDVPKNLLLAGHFSDTLPVVGEVTNVSLVSGEQITSVKIGPTINEGKGLSGVVKPGMRAVGIQVSQVTTAGGLLLPGDRVDVLAAFGAESPFFKALFGDFGDESPTVVMTVLQDVEVLSVAQEAQQRLPAADRDKDGDGKPDTLTSGQVDENVEEQPNAGTVTVQVDPQQAQLLVAVQEEANKVWTTLRGFGDEDQIDLKPINISELIKQFLQ